MWAFVLSELSEKIAYDARNMRLMYCWQESEVGGEIAIWQNANTSILWL